jgi:hypothetical protein
LHASMSMTNAVGWSFIDQNLVLICDSAQSKLSRNGVND